MTLRNKICSNNTHPSNFLSFASLLLRLLLVPHVLLLLLSLLCLSVCLSKKVAHFCQKLQQGTHHTHYHFDGLLFTQWAMATWNREWDALECCEGEMRPYLMRKIFVSPLQSSCCNVLLNHSLCLFVCLLLFLKGRLLFLFFYFGVFPFLPTWGCSFFSSCMHAQCYLLLLSNPISVGRSQDQSISHAKSHPKVPFLSPFVRDLWGSNLCIHLARKRKKKYPTLLKRGGCLSGQRHGFYLHFVVVVLELSLMIGLHSFRDCFKLPTTMMKWVRLSCVRCGYSCLLIAKDVV